MNPTMDVLEKRLAALEGGVAGLCFGSGMAAITAAVLNICRAGQHIVSSSSLYGGTVTLFGQTLPKLGHRGDVRRSGEPANFAKAIRDNTRLVYIETIGNPKNDVLDYEEIAADRARARPAGDLRQHRRYADAVSADRARHRHRRP